MAAVDTTVERPPRNLLGITPVSLRFVEERIARRASDTVPVSVEMRVEVSQQRLHRPQMVTRPDGDDRTSGDAAGRPFADTGPADSRAALAILLLMEEGIVHCEEHGETTACFVCQHLSRSLHSRAGGLGFVLSETAGAPQAWCFECDSLLQSRGGDWDTIGESFAGVTLACAGCFERMRVLNTRQRA